MNRTGQKFIYFAIISALPFFTWILSNQNIHLITFLLVVIVFILSKYLKSLAFLRDTFEIIILFFTIEFLLNFIGLDKLFPLNHFIAILLLYFFLLRLKKYPAGRFYLQIGKIKDNLLIGFSFALFSMLGLSIWFLLQKNSPYTEMTPQTSTLFLIPMGLGFALINSIYEESVFRSILLSYFTREVGFALALVIQAIWFSFLHFQAGFPSGEIGVLLTFIFGLMMGYLIHRTKGIFLPVCIHFLADLTIFILALLKMKGNI